jgi:hypothetical protein
MISRKNTLFIIVSLAAGGLLTWWLYVRFHVLFFIIFIPILSIGAPVIKRLFYQKKEDAHSKK